MGEKAIYVSCGTIIAKGNKQGTEFLMLDEHGMPNKNKSLVFTFTQRRAYQFPVGMLVEIEHAKDKNYQIGEPIKLIEHKNAGITKFIENKRLETEINRQQLAELKRQKELINKGNKNVFLDMTLRGMQEFIRRYPSKRHAFAKYIHQELLNTK